MQRRILTATLAVFVCAQSARAAELSFTATPDVPSTTTNWSQLVVVPRFDPALGTLTAVAIRLNATLNAELIAENRSTSPGGATLTGGIVETVKIQAAGIPGFIDVVASASTFPVGPQSVATYDGTPFQSELPGGIFGPDTFRWTIQNGNIEVTQNYGSGDPVLNAFKGPGTQNMTVMADAMFSLSSSNGNVAAQATSKAGSHVTVIYTYTPIPEPTTIGMMVVGAGLLVIRRRR